jgi:hypothetical protein
MSLGIVRMNEPNPVLPQVTGKTEDSSDTTAPADAAGPDARGIRLSGPFTGFDDAPDMAFHAAFLQAIDKVNDDAFQSADMKSTDKL